MHGLLEQYGTLAAFLILFLEDLGIPMPIPADVVILFTGYRAHRHLIHPLLAYLMLVTAVNSSALILFAIIRRGGKPLIERFGKYLRLDAQRLDRAEGWIKRRGTLGLILARSVPGLRIATVVTCALLNFPIRRFLPVQILGSGLYIGFFFLLGYFFGPQVAERIHELSRPLRLAAIGLCAVALPVGLRLLNRGTVNDDVSRLAAVLSRGRRAGAALFSGFLGLIELTLLWTLSAALQRYLTHGQGGTENVLLALLHALLGHVPFGRALSYAVAAILALGMCLGLALVFFLAVLPPLRMHRPNLGLQALMLWLCCAVMLYAATLGRALAHRLIVAMPPALSPGQAGGLALAALALGFLGYAYVATEAHLLAVDRLSRERLALSPPG